LRLSAMHKFEVVDEQNIYLPELFLEGQRIFTAQRFDEAVAEAFRRQVQDLSVRLTALYFPGGRVKQVRFAEADRCMDKQWVKPGAYTGNSFGNTCCCRMRN